MNNIACAFKGLPSWVRRQSRVERWLWGKSLIDHAYKLHLLKPTQTPNLNAICSGADLNRS